MEQINKHICENCENKHDGTYGSGRFCSNKCARGFSTKNKRQEINQKVSFFLRKNKSEYLYTRNCITCSKEFTTKKENKKYCCVKCAQKKIYTDEEKKRKSDIQKKLVSEGRHVGWQTRNKRSYAELFFENVLINNNINFSVEFKINKRNLGFNNASNYFLDFYLHDYNIDLEIDGKQHEQPERKKNDNIRDEALTKYGITVYRIKWKNPKYNENYIKNEINKFLEFLETIKTE